MAVTSTDIAITCGLPTPVDGSPTDLQWSMWIDDVRRLIADRLGDLNALDQDNLDYVVREAVALKVKQPDPVVTVAVAVDDASTSKTYQRSSGQLTILDSWWDLLTPNTRDAGAWTIRPAGSRRGC